MKSSPRPSNAGLPLSTLHRLDQTCDRFEKAWLAGERPCLEEFLGPAPEPERRALLGELLKLDLEYCRRGGENPTPEKYRLRFPDQADLIRTIFAGETPLPTPTPNADRNLLFGVLALQMDFINRDVLIAAIFAAGLAVLALLTIPSIKPASGSHVRMH